MNAPGPNRELDRFVSIIGREAWQNRIDEIIAEQPLAGQPTLCGREVLRRHCIEVAIERQRRPGTRSATGRDARIVHLAADACRLHASLPAEGRRRFEQQLDQAMLSGQSLMPLFHLLRTAWLHQRRGFEVTFTGLADDASYDLHLSRGNGAAEVVCETLCAEQGRGVHRNAWFRLVDTVSPELRRWLAVNPGRYLLKMTLPLGLNSDDGNSRIPLLRQRITSLLDNRRRADGDAVAVIRLDPLVMGRTGQDESQVMSWLRHQFGPDTQLAVTLSSGGGVFALAAHAGREDDLPSVLNRRMTEVAPSRLSGRHPGILAMFIDQIELVEWRLLCREMRLEAEARRFLTTREASHVVSVAFTTRHELLDQLCPDGEFRFRNPRHVAAKHEGLAPSILSSN